MWYFASSSLGKNMKNILKPNTPSLVIIYQDSDIKIAEIAYYKAEKRGFEPGYEDEDWLAAELEFTT